MNDNAKSLVEHIEGLADDQFSMEYWLHFGPSAEVPECGCIGGWAEHLMADPAVNKANADQKVAAWLGMSRNMAVDLFYSFPTHGATREEAVVALKQACEGQEPWV